MAQAMWPQGSLLPLVAVGIGRELVWSAGGETSILPPHQAELLTLACFYTTTWPRRGDRTCLSTLFYLGIHIPALASCKEP